MFSITFLLLGNNMGFAVGGSSLLLLGFFILFSCYHFYNMISKDTDSPPDKKTPEVPIKKKERKNGTNFPTEDGQVKEAATEFENPEDMEIENPEAALAVEPAVEPTRYVSPLGKSIEKESSTGWLKEHRI